MRGPSGLRKLQFREGVGEPVSDLQDYDARCVHLSPVPVGLEVYRSGRAGR